MQRNQKRSTDGIDKANKIFEKKTIDKHTPQTSDIAALA